MAEPEPEQQSLTVEERRRNVRRVEEALEMLDGIEGSLVQVVFDASTMYGRLHRIEIELAAALGKPAPDPPPPIVQKILDAAEAKPPAKKKAAKKGEPDAGSE